MNNNYLKYTRKYLELKGGEYPCNNSTFFQLYKILYYFSKIQNINYNDLFFDHIMEICRHQTCPQNHPPGLQQPGFFCFSNTDNYNILKKTNINNCRRALGQYPDHDDNNLGLIESVIGLMIDYECVNAQITNFINDIRTNNRRIFIIDFPNILEHCIEAIQDEYMRGDHVLFLALNIIKNFCREELLRGNYIIIVFKPSHQLHVRLDRWDNFKEYFFNDGDPITNFMDTNDDDDVFKRRLDETFFIINFQLPPGIQANASNYDDFIFWVISISFFNLLSANLLNIRLLTLLTLDTQNLTDMRHGRTNRKNIFFYDAQNFYHIQYIRQPDTVIRIDTVINQNSTLTLYIRYVHTLLNHYNRVSIVNIAQNGALIGIQNPPLDSVDIHDVDTLSIFHNIFNVPVTFSAIPYPSLIDYVHSYYRNIRIIPLNEFKNNNILGYCGGLIFYANIKYIQHSLYGRYDGTITRNTLNRLFGL